MSTRNFQSGTFENAAQIFGERLKERHAVAERVCSKCLIPCEKNSVTRGRAFSEAKVRDPEYETLWALGPQCGVEDLDHIIASSKICDELKLDTISTGVSVGFAVELSERGILTVKDCDGLNLRFGDGRAMIEVIKKIGLEQEIGKILGKGMKKQPRGFRTILNDIQCI